MIQYRPDKEIINDGGYLAKKIREKKQRIARQRAEFERREKAKLDEMMRADRVARAIGRESEALVARHRAEEKARKKAKIYFPER